MARSSFAQYAPQPLPPMQLPYVEGAAIPYGYRVDEQMRTDIIGAGAITFGAGYFLALGIGLNGAIVSDVARRIERKIDDSSDEVVDPLTDDEDDEEAEDITENRATAMFIPCVGPLLTISDANTKGPATALLVVDSGVQFVGVGLMLWGLLDTEKRLLRNDVNLGSMSLHQAKFHAVASPLMTGGAVSGAF